MFGAEKMGSCLDDGDDEEENFVLRNAEGIDALFGQKSVCVKKREQMKKRVPQTDIVL